MVVLVCAASNTAIFKLNKNIQQNSQKFSKNIEAKQLTSSIKNC